jgi:hypothetical protein
LRLLLPLEIPVGDEGSTVQVLLTARDRDGALGASVSVVEFRRAGAVEREAPSRNAMVERAVASICGLA